MGIPTLRHLFRRAGLAGFALLVTALFSGVAVAEWIEVGDGGDPVTVTLLESDGSRSVVEITIGGFEATNVEIDGKKYYSISLPQEGREESVGLPALPNVRRSLIIPDDLQMAVRVIDADFVEFPDLPVAPSKGHLPRTIDPAMVPFTFDPFYQSDGQFPASEVEADDPYIMRDYRGMVLDANVFQFSPANATLRVFTRLVVEVAPAGPGQINVLDRNRLSRRPDRQFEQLYADHFLNYEGNRYVPVQEDGGLLIITYDAFEPYIQPLAEWKRQKGIETKVANLSEAGSSYSQIASYIASEYQSWNLAYVLLIGDAAQLPKYGSDSDPVYGLIVGSDNYPEIFVGRFSAENPDHVITQVERTIHYERDVGTGSGWAQKGMGVASNQGPGHYGEYDDEHEDLIRLDLLSYGYTEVDQIYDPYGTATQVSNALNAGRGIVNYTGHGSTTSWSSTGFSNSHVNQLVNDNLLPFIVSVACNNGTFTSTCFAEAWQRATHNGVPTGAIACYMSYISQSWNPPMYAQDEAVDLLVADQMRTIGGLWFNGSCHMMDMAGSQGIEEFRNWTIFGDPSIAVRTKDAQELAVSHGGVILIGMDQFEVDVPGVEGALCALYAGGVLYGTGLTDATGHALITMAEPPTDPMTLTLTVTAYNKVTVQEDIEVLPPDGPYLVFHAVSVLDEDGDGDGVFDEGETVGLEVTLLNVGVDEALKVMGTLSSDDPYLTLIEGDRAFPDIPPDGTRTNLLPFMLEVAGNVPDGHTCQFQLQIAAANGTWEAGFSLSAQAPVVENDGFTVNDLAYGNGNGWANPGETLILVFDLANTGHSDAENLTGTLSSSDPNVVIHLAEAECEALPAGEVAALHHFRVEILPSCPDYTNLPFHIDLVASNGFTSDFDFDLSVGGWFDDFEADRDWTIGAPEDNASAGIWERVDPVGTEWEGQPVAPEDDHTPGTGTDCFVTQNGEIGGIPGASDVDNGRTTLFSPVFDLTNATSAEIRYWRWYSNDTGLAAGDVWLVYVTNDGQNWVILESTNQSQAEWVEKSFELTEFITLTGQVQVKFVAADINTPSTVEAGVDDFLLIPVQEVLSDVDDREAAPTKLTIGEIFPNPFNPKTTITFELPKPGDVELAIFDITGRKVTSLVRTRLERGQHQATWFGKDQEGRPVASGIYFARLMAGEQMLTKKMTLLK